MGLALASGLTIKTKQIEYGFCDGSTEGPIKLEKLSIDPYPIKVVENGEIKTQPSLRLPQWYKSPSVDMLSARSWLLTVHHDSLVRDSLTQPLPGSRTDNQSRKAVNSRLSLKIPTLSPLLLPTATKPTSVPTPAKLTTNSVKLSIPPRLSLKSPPRSKKDQSTVPSRSDPPSPSPPPSPETPNQRSAGPRTAKMSKKMTTLPTTSTVNPPPLPSPTSPRR